MNRWPETVEFHRTLLADRARTEAYRRAILAIVRENDVVLDVGTGTGVLACMAARAGARRVYAIEAGDIVDLARELCRQNGQDDRIVFLNEQAERVELPERVDVVVTETMGNFGLEEGVLGIAVEARTRFLHEHGRIIPHAISLFAAPVELPDTYARLIDSWADDLYGIDFSPLRAIAANTMQVVTLEPGALLADAASLARIELLEIDTTDVHAEATWTARRAGTLHGFGGWFAAELAPGITLSNAPPLAAPSWNHAWLPLERPVTLRPGDRVRLTLGALANGTVWTWRVAVEGTDRGDHSTLWGVPRLRQRLRGDSPDNAPTLTRGGEAERDLLGLLDGRTTVRAGREELLRRYADFFHSGDDVSAFMHEIIARCER